MIILHQPRKIPWNQRVSLTFHRHLGAKKVGSWGPYNLTIRIRHGAKEPSRLAVHQAFEAKGLHLKVPRIGEGERIIP